MAENINKIDVDEIMQQIRAEIKEKGLDSSMLSFEDVPFDKEVSHADSEFRIGSLLQSVEYLNIRNQIEPYKPITGNPAAVFVKKVIRKLVKFYFLPVITEQNALNHHTANAVQQLSSYVSADSAVDVKALEAKVEEMELILAANKKEIEALRSQLSALTEENKD